ncbi:hypothetical protein D3C74_407490 [compost metagenome]
MTGTSRSTVLPPPLSTSVWASWVPSPTTLNCTVPLVPWTSSTPTVAVNASHCAARKTRTDEFACVPRPFSCATPRSERGLPSFSPCSPLDRSRSTGPHPLVVETNGRSLTQFSPPFGGTTTHTDWPASTDRSPTGAAVVVYEPPEVSV